MAERRNEVLKFFGDFPQSPMDQVCTAPSQPMFLLPFPPQLWSLEEWLRVTSESAPELALARTRRL
jgi:hypothetical protein